MNKKGFSLVELLLTLALMAILVVLIVPGISSIREDSLNKSYEDKIKKIEIAAEDWAMENQNNIKSDGSCTYVVVGELIKQNYLTGDDKDKSILKNPKTGESMNSMEVCVKAIRRKAEGIEGGANIDKYIIEYEAEVE